jgi:hypothetical protein
MWTKNGVEIANGARPAIDLPIGVHTFQLTIITSKILTISGWV